MTEKTFIAAKPGEHVRIHGRPYSGRTTLGIECVKQMSQPQQEIVCLVSSNAAKDEWENQEFPNIQVFLVDGKDDVRSTLKHVSPIALLVIDDVRPILLEFLRSTVLSSASSVTITVQFGRSKQVPPPFWGNRQWFNVALDTWTENRLGARILPVFVFFNRDVTQYIKLSQ